MTTHVLALGVNDYRDPVSPLKCCQRDAREVVSVFKELFGFYARLIEEAKTHVVIEELARLEKILKPGDTFVFYFSGHGKSHQQDHYLLLPDVDILELNQAKGGTSEIGTVSCTHLNRLTSRPAWQGVRRVFILDACRTPLIPRKSGDEAKFDSDFLLRDFLISGVHQAEKYQSKLTLVNSCNLGQSAAELMSQGHGLFTTVFLERARDAGKRSGRLVLDESFCALLSSNMQLLASEARLPKEAQHQPVVVGDPVELRAERSHFSDEQTEWEICLANPTVENLQQFIRNFPQSVCRTDALARLRKFSMATGPHSPSSSDVQMKAPMSPGQDLPKVSLYPKEKPRPNRLPDRPLPASHSQNPKPGPSVGLRVSPTESVKVSEVATRDERLWKLVQGEPTREHYEQYLREASADAPMRQAAVAGLKKLESSQKTQKAESKPSIRKTPPSNGEWNPEPPPEFKLSLDSPARKAADWFRKRS